MRILEEFWYGNIEPTEYDTSSCKEYKKLLDSNQFRQTQNPHAELREELCRFRKTGPK